MMDLIRTPPSTRPTQSQLDEVFGHAEDLQVCRRRLEQEHVDHVRELEEKAAKARFEFDSSRRLSDRLGQQVLALEARATQAEAVVAAVLPNANFFPLAPSTVAPSVSTHSRVLSTEQIARAQSSPHLGLLRAVFGGSQDRSRSCVATLSVTQPAPRPLADGYKGSGESVGNT